MRPEYLKKSVRSFVIRGGRITDGQKSAFDTWWPKYGLSLFDGKADFDVIFKNQNPVVLEIGFGMGDSLLDMTKAYPQTNFVGIEVHPPGVGRLVSCAGKEGVDNLRVYMADANDVLKECVQPQNVDRLQLFFPDPWHKKKHNKRRIVNHDFLTNACRVLKADGYFHMATDWEPYAEYVMEQLTDFEGFTNASGDYLYAEKPEYRPMTKFERRGKKLGHGVWDIIFKKSVKSQ